MTRENKIDRVKDLIEGFDNWDLMVLNNEYCDSAQYYDDRVYATEELDELCYGMKPTEILDRYTEIANCDFFKEGVYVEGSDYVDELVDIDYIAEYIVDNDNDLGNDEIATLLSDFELDRDNAEELIYSNIEYFRDNDPLMESTTDIDERWEGFKAWTLQQIDEELSLDASEFIEDYYEDFVEECEDGEEEDE